MRHTHVGKHGKGRSAVKYTKDATAFYKKYEKSGGKAVILKDGTYGVRIRIKVDKPGGGKKNVGGYWKPDGRVITLFD